MPKSLTRESRLVPHRSLPETEASHLKAGAKKKAKEEQAARDLIEYREQKMENAGPMRKCKANINALCHVLATHDMSMDNRSEIKKRIKEYKDQMAGLPTEIVDPKILRKHMTFISSSPELIKVFRCWWLALVPFLDDDQNLDKNGYETLQMALQFALNGNLNEESAVEYSAEQFVRDEAYYGDAFSQEVVYDMLYEIVSTWLVVFTPQSYTCFLWALLDSVFDVTTLPFKLRKKQFIMCVPSVPEGTLYQNWFNSKGKIQQTLEVSLNRLKQVEVQERGMELTMTDTLRTEDTNAINDQSEQYRTLDDSLQNIQDDVLYDVMWDVELSAEAFNGLNTSSTAVRILFCFLLSFLVYDVSSLSFDLLLSACIL
jgi:hypothetical protein